MSGSPVISRRPWWPIVLAAVAPTLATVLYLHAADSTSAVQILDFASKALLFSFPAAWWLIVERRARAVSFSSRRLTDGENVAQFEHPRERKRAARGDIALGVGSGALIGASLWCVYLVMFRGLIDADVLTDVGFCLSYAGRAEEGLESAHKAMRLNPHYPAWYLMQLGQIYFDARRYEEAVATFERLHGLETTNIRLYSAASHAALGHAGEARKAIAQALELDPQATLQKWTDVKMAPYGDPKDLEHFRKHLRKAGLPD